METHPLGNSELEFLVADIITHKNPYDFSKIHRHAYYEILLFDKGLQGEHLIDFDTYSIQDRTLNIIAPNQVHLLTRKKGEDGLVLQFTHEFLHTSLHTIPPNLLYALKSNPETILSASDYDSLILSLHHLKTLSSMDVPFKQEKLRHYFSYTIYQIAGILPNTTTNIGKDNLSIRFLELVEHGFMHNRKVSSYAERLNISVTKLNAQIKEKFGKTPLQIIHEMLVIEIKRLIIIEQLSHKEISHYLHFDSQSSYNRFVNKHIGCNPSELTKRLEIHK